MAVGILDGLRTFQRQYILFPGTRNETKDLLIISSHEVRKPLESICQKGKSESRIQAICCDTDLFEKGETSSLRSFLT